MDECPHGLGMPQCCYVCNGKLAIERKLDAQEDYLLMRALRGKRERENAAQGAFTGPRWARGSAGPHGWDVRVSARWVHGRKDA